MKTLKPLPIIFCIIWLCSCACCAQHLQQQVVANANGNIFKTGDIIFQTSLSVQSQAIQQATGSIYSHCGIIFERHHHFYVYEAVQPVKITPLQKWVARGKNGHFVVKRLKNAGQVLTPAVITAMQKTAASFINKNYNAYFEWTDKRIYCSELVWKIYNRAAGINIGRLQRLKDFNLSNPVVKQKLAERYGQNIPLNETVISPAAIYQSNLLATLQVDKLKANNNEKPILIPKLKTLFVVCCVTLLCRRKMKQKIFYNFF